MLREDKLPFKEIKIKLEKSQSDFVAYLLGKFGSVTERHIYFNKLRSNA